VCTEVIGIPYRDGGRTRDGADCYGVAAIASLALFGRPLPGPGEAFAKAANWRPVAIGGEAAGDVAECRTIVDGGEHLHCALVLAPGVILTTTAATGSIRVRYSPRNTLGIIRFWRAPA
jgi:cell wall-associated NlpC family hydrolase